MADSTPRSTLLTPQPRLLALDLDGTLLNGEAQVSPRNAAALRLALAQGLTLVLATGRRHSYAMKVLRGLGLPPETLLLSSNGAVLRTLDHRLLHRAHMLPAATDLLCRELSGYRDALVVTFDCLGQDGEDLRGSLLVESLQDLRAAMGRWIEVNEPSIATADSVEQALEAALEPGGPGAPIQMMLAGPVERMRAAETHLLRFPGVAATEETTPVHSQGPPPLIQLNRTEYPERDLSILDILPAGVSKGTALRRLAGERGIRPLEMMAIGDNWNDLSMLQVAGHPVLMGNAPPDLQRYGAGQTPPWPLTAANTDDGVALAVEAVLALQPVASS